MYDYIIVGAGSAGCVLASRMSEDLDCTVLLLEAGPPDDVPEIRVPAAAPLLLKGSVDWDYLTTPQCHAAGRQFAWPRGRTLGGSSSINGMAYIRGNPADYDTWRDAYGCSGWGYADLLPYFLRAENQQHGASAFHGVGGPLCVEDLRYIHPLTQAWVDAAVASGFALNEDFNGIEQDGVGFYQLTAHEGRRWSTADAYLRPVIGRRNLTVETGAWVTRILFEEGRAVGVRYVRDGVALEALARREIILSGGAVNSPHLLLLSGIGPARHLREWGIEPIVDAPLVGERLQDHPTCLPEWCTPNTRNMWEEATPENFELWRREGKGPFASTGAEGTGFFRVRAGAPMPDLQIVAIAGPSFNQGGGLPGRRGFSQLLVLIDVRSRGRLTLCSPDPFVKPVIDPAYLADEADLDIFLGGLRLARRITDHQPLAGHITSEVAPGKDVNDDAQLREWIRNNLGTIFHPTSTCAMGGEKAVCDPELRVRGVDGLRVVDASVMPEVPHGNPNAPIIALAERAADLIKGNVPLG